MIRRTGAALSERGMRFYCPTLGQTEADAQALSLGDGQTWHSAFAARAAAGVLWTLSEGRGVQWPLEIVLLCGGRTSRWSVRPRPRPEFIATAIDEGAGG